LHHGFKIPVRGRDDANIDIQPLCKKEVIGKDAIIPKVGPRTVPGE